jgi:hypothetical protein
MGDGAALVGQLAAERADVAALNPREPMEKQVLPARELTPPVELIERKIYLIRGQRVMLDSDLAELYRYPRRP